MKYDYSIFEKVSLQELINNDDVISDTDTDKSDKDENYLSDEEFKNNYTFLESFKKSNKNKVKKKYVKSPPEPVKEEVDESENESDDK